jgi:hypothetical protein
LLVFRLSDLLGCANSEFFCGATRWYR